MCVFQDVDPKGTGVLKADDIPLALSTASFVINQRLNSERYMHSIDNCYYNAADILKENMSQEFNTISDDGRM